MRVLVDKNITPGIMTLGKVSQLSEAVTPTVKVGKPAEEETLDVLASSITITSGDTAQFDVIVGNASKFDSTIILAKSSDENVLMTSISSNVQKMNAGAKVTVFLIAKEVTKETTVTVTVSLASDPTKKQTVSVLVKPSISNSTIVL